jgi:hypothetical protein
MEIHNNTVIQKKVKNPEKFLLTTNPESRSAQMTDKIKDFIGNPYKKDLYLHEIHK